MGLKFFFFVWNVSMISSNIQKLPRIASGSVAIDGENLDYALIKSVFQNQFQTCGGVLVEPQYILTAASCVYDVREGIASIVNVTFPQMKVTIPKLQVFIHESYNSTTFLNNIAIVKLMRATRPDGKSLMYAKLSRNGSTDAFVGEQVRACGFGTTSNYLDYPKNMMCTQLNVQPSADCSSLPNTICTYWTDRDNNICSNDYGGPIYTYVYVGTKIIQTTIGISSHAPDYRKNAPCYDGHKVVHTQIGAYIDWIDKNTT